MKTLKELFIRLVKEDSGQDLIEYALVAGLVGLGSIAMLQTIATDLTTVFTKVSSSLVVAGG